MNSINLPVTAKLLMQINLQLCVVKYASIKLFDTNDTGHTTENIKQFLVRIILLQIGIHYSWLQATKVVTTPTKTYPERQEWNFPGKTYNHDCWFP
jgi:hypothetical protein